jgi:hypothetical protein
MITDGILTVDNTVYSLYCQILLSFNVMNKILVYIIKKC